MSSSAAYRAVMLGAGLILLTLLVEQLMTLLLAIVLTLIISLPLAAAASAAERRGVPRAVGALLGLACTITAIIVLSLAVVPEFISQAKNFAQRLPAILASVEHHLHAVTGRHTPHLSAELTRFVQSYTHHPQRLIGPLESVGLSVLAVVVALLLIIVVALLIAINPAPLITAAMKLLPQPRRQLAGVVLARIRRAWLGWLTAVGIDMIVLGTLLFAGMELVRLPFAVGFAVFSALLTVIPNYGSIISAIPPILVGLAQSPGKALLVLAVYVIVNQIEGNLILPLVMARTVDLHPAVVAIGVLVMAALFGLLGIVIAVPLLSLTIILVEALWIEPQEAAAAAGPD
jgi:predicted PurR-regulated permease PerM